MLKLAFKVIRMQGHFLVPSAVLDDKALRLLLVALHTLFDHSLENRSKLIGYFFNRLLLEFLDITDHSIVCVLSDKLELSVETVIELGH